MLNINALTPRPMPTDHGGAPPTGADGSSNATGFSSMLRQTQTQTSTAPANPGTAQARAPKTDAPTSTATAAHDADADADAPAPRSDDATPAPDDAPPSPTTSRARAALKLTAGEPGTALREAEPEATKAEAAPPSDALTTDTRTADTPAAPPTTLDPAVAHWLAGQQRTPPGDVPAARSDASAGTPVIPHEAAPAARSNGARAAAPVDTMTTQDRAPRATDPATPAPAFAAVLAEQHAAEHKASGLIESRGDTRIDTRTDAVGAAAFAPAPSVVHEAASPVTVALPVPVTSPDFAQALGVQMSVLAKDGIQHAELHLNPAEMGPVSVQIVMDGTQARVDFGADMAATRHAIEAGLPELASALRDAGFTLAGGGVSQHAGGRGQSDRSDDDTGGNGRRGLRRVSDEGTARVSTAARRAVTRGGLDLYA